MVNGRNKGATFERSIANMLFADLGLNAKRDIEQYRAADHANAMVESISRFAQNGGHKWRKPPMLQEKNLCLSISMTASPSR
jgi:hypothetical protein